MINIAYTYHAEARMQQRGISSEDIELILEYGTQVDEKTWLLRKHDVDRETRIHKRQIQKLNRLANRKAERRGECITPIDEKTWLLRKSEVNRQIRILKQQIQKLNSLENHKVVMSGKHVVTAYLSRPADQKRALRYGRRKGLVK